MNNVKQLLVVGNTCNDCSRIIVNVMNDFKTKCTNTFMQCGCNLKNYINIWIIQLFYKLFLNLVKSILRK